MAYQTKLSSTETAQLPVWDQNPYAALAVPAQLPLPSEPHVMAWEGYEAESRVWDVWSVLQTRLVQFQFPIQLGISQSFAYKVVTKQGVEVAGLPEATGLCLNEPGKLQLSIYPTLAGSIPVIVASNRQDFVSLVRALTGRNEPTAVPDSMGACMVAGYNNWDRIRAYRAQWAAENPDDCADAAWQAEFQRLIPQKELYQDRFIILHDGPYSGVPAREMGLDEAAWRAISLKIRLEHECTHYFTKRIFGVMRRHIFDELLADYAGIVAASGYFRADWFLRFMGLEAYPNYREGGRLQNYLDGMPPQSTDFQEVQTCLKRAAENLERFDRQFADTDRSFSQQALVLLAICGHTLPELAAETATERLGQTMCLLEKQAASQVQAGG